MLQATPSFPGIPTSPRALLHQPDSRSSGWFHSLSPRDRLLSVLLGLTVVFNLLDASFTLFAVRSGLAIETNPLMSELLQQDPLLFMLVKIAVVSLGVSMLWHLRQFKMAVVGSVGAFLTYTAIVIWHIYGLELL